VVSDRPAQHPGATALALLLACLAAAAPARSAGPTFTDATAEAGIDYRNVCGSAPDAKGWISESLGAGAAWLDYDGDGKLDLYVVNGSTYDRQPDRGEPNRLYRGDGKGRFAEVTDRAGVGHRGWGLGVAVGDVDNDGDPDLYVTNFGANVMYRNDGDGTFTDVTAEAGVGNPLLSASAAFFDMEGDGDLDLYVTNYMDCDRGRVPSGLSDDACIFNGVRVFCGPLNQVPQQDALYRNRGDGTFEDVTRAAGIHLASPRYALGVVTADYDGDGDQDIYVANDSLQNSLWENRGGGRFVDVGLERLAAMNADGRAQAGMGADFGDYDGDRWLDLVVTNFTYDLNTVYRSVGGRFFVDESNLAGLGVTMLALSWGTAFVDLDRDADLDLFIANGHIYPQADAYDLGWRYRQPNHVFVNQDGRFRDVTSAAGPGLDVERSFRGAAFGDYDDDGDVDVFLTAMDEPGLLLRNDTRAPGHFLRVALEGTRSNRDGVGARVTLSAGGRTQIRERKGGGSYLSASDPRLHFGLGSATRIERIEVRWPSGRVDTQTDLPVDRQILLRETE
jgi:hypothetical protein